MVPEASHIIPKFGPLSEIKTHRGEADTWFPKGLMGAYTALSKEELEKHVKPEHRAPVEEEKSAALPVKKLSAQFMAFRLAHKFSSLDLRNIESLKENKI